MLVNTEDVADVVSHIDLIIAALQKAEIPRAELERLREIMTATRTPATTPRYVGATGRGGLVAEGIIDKFQRGTHGFAPVWRSHWIRLLRGEMQVFDSRRRPDQGMSLRLSLPLSIQQTKVEPGATRFPTMSSQ